MEILIHLLAFGIPALMSLAVVLFLYNLIREIIRDIFRKDDDN
jgi:hypothetical protein